MQKKEIHINGVICQVSLKEEEELKRTTHTSRSIKNLKGRGQLKPSKIVPQPSTIECAAGMAGARSLEETPSWTLGVGAPENLQVPGMGVSDIQTQDGNC